MDVLILRLIHIGVGAFWVGAVFTNVLFVQPTAAAIGPEDEQAQLGRLRRDLMTAGWVTVVGLGIAVAAMATARYWGVVV